jgi:hypothetical protein
MAAATVRYGRSWPPKRASQMGRATAGQPDRGPASRRLSSSCKILDGFGGEPLAADAPLAARDFWNSDPAYAAHVLAFDRHHRIGLFLNYLTLLLAIEYVLDRMNFYQSHCRSPQWCSSLGLMAA